MRRSCLERRASAINACFGVALNALSLFGRGSRRYFGVSFIGARSHFDTLLVPLAEWLCSAPTQSALGVALDLVNERAQRAVEVVD